LQGQVVRKCFQRAQRREGVRQIRRAELKDLLGLREVAKAMRAQILEHNRLRKLSLNERVRDAGEQDLPAVPIAIKRAVRLSAGPK